MLEQSETEVNKRIIPQRLTVLKHVEVPALEIVHDLEDGGPLARTYIDYLPEALLIFFYLVLIRLSILPVQLLQEVVQVPLMPLGRVIGLLCSDVQPRLSLHVLLAFTGLLQSQLVQLAIFDDLSGEFGLLLDRIGDGQILELLQDVDH